ncbi:MAG: glutamate--tRNA ligase [Candidatus Aenigmatarchaeota archaeon]
MTEGKEKDLETKIWEFSLRNAIFHNGNAQINAVLGKIMSENSDLDAKEVRKNIKEIVKEINDLPLEVQKEEAEKISLSLEKEEKEQREGLPELENVEEGEIVTRAAPNPNGPLHIGSARAFLLSYLYKKKYGGRFILRYDDTDPKTPGKEPKKKFYEWVKEDLEWLGCDPDLTVYATDRMDTYYEIIYELLDNGNAYICTCDAEGWGKLRDEGEACPCRDLSNDENLERWERMLDGEYGEREAVVRIKTDLQHKNPAIRDWPAARILEDVEHPRVGNEYLVWPLYNLASGIDDHELGVTHIFRAQEHSTNTEKQKYLYKHLGWNYPTAIHHGRLSLQGIILSTSTIREGLSENKFEGWDDPRLGTLRALKRRGYQPESIVELIKQIGANPNDVSISSKNLASINRKLIDNRANRYFFVRDPIEIKVENPLRDGEIKLPKHPQNPNKGNRILETHEWFLIDNEDFEDFSGQKIRLKELYNIELSNSGKCIGDGIVQEMPKIQWVPVEEKIHAKVKMPDGSVVSGAVENTVLEEDIGSVVQFERFGFVRIDQKNDSSVMCYFSHK